MNFEAVVDLATLDGVTGFKVNGEATYDRAGWSVASAGDVNGDGIEDFVVGAWGADPHGNESGVAYVVFGQATGLPAMLDLSTLDGTNGFRLNGAAAFDRTGYSVGRAGDFNGDGIDDLVIAAGTASPGGVHYAGAIYVVYGSDTGFAASLELSALDGTNGLRLNGVAVNDTSGSCVGRAGDINGDGFDDLFVGAKTFATPGGGYYAGATFVVFGTDAGFAADFDLADLDGTNGFRIDGAAYDLLGMAIAAAGDVNGDGFDDLIIAAAGADPDGLSNAGAAYVVFGTDAGFPAARALTDLDGSNGFRIDGPEAGEGLGKSVASAGDINGDGFADLIIGSNKLSTPGVYSGAAYVVFGGSSFGADFDVADLDGTNGFRIHAENPGDNLGSAVAPAGDVNGDGLADLIVSALSAAPDGRMDSGASYVVYGRDGGFTADLDLASLDGTNGFKLIGAVLDNSGRSVASGDFNDDGLSDLIIGASLSGGEAFRSGAAYVVYGRQGTIHRVGGSGADTFLGRTEADDLSGGDGNDVLRGMANDDVLGGGGGHDTLDGGTGADAMTGGSGDDVYFVDDAGDTTTEAVGEGSDRVRTSVSFTLAANLDKLTLEGSGDINGTGNSLANVIDGNGGANTLSGGDGADLIKGGGGDDVLNGDGGADQLLGGIGTDSLDGGGDADRLEGGDGNDTILGGTGADILEGGADNDTLTGGAGADQLLGGAGTDTLDGGSENDLLNGGLGADAMTGGAGDDTFYVDDLGDTTVEALGEGTDVVRAALTWTLGANLERLILEGSGDIGGTGNGLANVLNGNGGANVLDGGAGADIINGGLGADTLIGGTGADILTAGGGADTFVVRQESVYSSAVPAGRVLEIDIVNDLIALQGDRLDLSAIDAITGGGDDAFTLVGAFSNTAGQMTLSFAGGNTTLSLDVDGDGKADYRMTITGDVRGDSGGWLL